MKVCSSLSGVLRAYIYFFNLFIYLWLCWVFVSVRGLSPVAASGGHSSSRCAGLSPSRPLLLRSTVSRRAGSVVVAHGLSCSAACGIFPDQGSSPCPLHWQADSQPLRHQGSPKSLYFINKFPKAIICPFIYKASVKIIVNIVNTMNRQSPFYFLKLFKQSIISSLLKKIGLCSQ